jgi:hypothetical protein
MCTFAHTQISSLLPRDARTPNAYHPAVGGVGRDVEGVVGSPYLAAGRCRVLLRAGLCFDLVRAVEGRDQYVWPNAGRHSGLLLWLVILTRFPQRGVQLV